jgi:hypothetical protein
MNREISVDRVTDLFNSPFFKCPRVRPCECGCIHEDSLLPIPPGVDSTWWMEYRTRGCLAVFPRLKGRTNSSLWSILPV